MPSIEREHFASLTASPPLKYRSMIVNPPTGSAFVAIASADDALAAVDSKTSPFPPIE